METKYDSHGQLEPMLTIPDPPSQIFVVRFSPDCQSLSAGCEDGTIRIFSTRDGKMIGRLNTFGTSKMPMTSIRYRPPVPGQKPGDVILSVNADGSVHHWDVEREACLHQIKDDDNHLYCVDYRYDGEQFATAGQDYAVRVYDEARRTEVATLASGWNKAVPGHSNQVFSLKFHDEHPNILISGGWDNTVQIWDVRQETSVRRLTGPHISGDAVDVAGNTILTGSYRTHEQLQLWDFRSGQLVTSIDWHQSLQLGGGSGSSGGSSASLRTARSRSSSWSNSGGALAAAAAAPAPCRLYTAQFSKRSATLIAAGGSGANEAKVFDRTRGNKLAGTICGLSAGVFTLDFAPDDSMLAVGGGDTTVRVFDLSNVTGAALAGSGERKK